MGGGCSGRGKRCMAWARKEEGLGSGHVLEVKVIGQAGGLRRGVVEREEGQPTNTCLASLPGLLHWARSSTLF